MIRRDYLLRQIEDFVAALAKLAGLSREGQWPEASAVAGSQFQALAGAEAGELVRLSDAELLARLIRGEPTQFVENKILMLATLFKANGDILAGQGEALESHLYYLKGLHLLLESVSRNGVARRPDFLPSIDAFLLALADSPLPLPTSVMLMRHFEEIGEFAKAEDILFGLLEAEPSNADLLDFGTVFYQRLLPLTDRALAAGNLPRAEVNAGLAELAARKARLTPC